MSANVRRASAPKTTESSKKMPATSRENPPELPPVPQNRDEEPDFLASFWLYQYVVIHGIKEPLQTERWDVRTGEYIVFPFIQVDAKRTAESSLMKQGGKEVKWVECIARISTENPRSRVKVNIGEERDWKEIMNLLERYHKAGKSGFKIEVTTYFDLIDISSRSPNTSAEYPTSGGFDTTGRSPQTLRPKRPLEVTNGPEPSSSSPRFAKCPRILEDSDDEQSATTAQNQRSIEPDTLRIEREIITYWRCEERNCHNFGDCCWIAFDDSHIQLRITDLVSWVDDIECGDAITGCPSRELTKRLLNRLEKEKGIAKPAVLSAPGYQVLHTPTATVLYLAAPAAPIAPTAPNTVTSRDICNMIMTKWMQDATEALTTNNNQQFNFLSTYLFNLANPPNTSSNPTPTSIPEALLAAKRILDNEGYELDLLPRITNEDVVHMGIRMDIFRAITDGLRNPDWHARMKHIESTLNTGKKASTARKTASISSSRGPSRPRELLDTWSSSPIG
ncbi:hypothetical protein GX51_07639 [Blastomyces parvus]|uniref:Uncharacterized protein n=1 Tax=Blastomyces parvus TaxID=2060905 RepID=A0A2B7WJK5_9EURO|nr:hypothetical protein GX51_07639 [Blastomyces parvus]